MTIPASANPLLLNASTGGYAIERSVRFNSSDSAYLSRTPATAGSDTTITFSAWIKRSTLGVQIIFATGSDANNRAHIGFVGDNITVVGRIGGVKVLELRTAAIYRDFSAWMHICAVVDTSNGTSSDRCRIYVNGSRVTSFSVETYSSSTTSFGAASQKIGAVDNASPPYYLNAYLADVHFCDGYAYDPSYFTEFDDNGILQPKAFTGSYGTNGFHLDFSDNSTAAALGTDTSGNGNDWTVHNISASTQSAGAVKFDGNGDYLLASNAGGGDFDRLTGSGVASTVEMYVFFAALTSPRSSLVGSWGGSQTGWTYDVTTGGDIFVATNSAGPTISLSSKIAAGQWMHLAFVNNGSTITVYKNGINVGSIASQSPSSYLTSLSIGSRSDNSLPCNGIISNMRVVKGTALYTSNFTPPGIPLTNVTNTKLLCCQSSSSATAAAVAPGSLTTVGDTSPVLAVLSTADSLVDVPTNGTQTDTGLGNEVRGNYATLNPLDKSSSINLSNGNLTNVGTVTNVMCRSTIFVSSGKWYYEATLATYSGNPIFGWASSSANLASWLGNSTSSWGYAANAMKYSNGSGSSYGASFGAGDVIGIAADLDAGTLVFYKNGVSQGTAYSNLSGELCPAFSSGASTTVDFNFGQRPFAYQAPSGFKSLCTANLPAPLVTKPSEYMDVLTWLGTGTASSRTFTGLNFGPDLVWAKDRSTTSNHTLYDKVRGTGKLLSSNLEGSAATNSQWGYISSFNSDGFTTTAGSTDNSYWNVTNDAYVAWCWDAGDTTAPNNDGSIISSVRANPTAGFSIVTYTGNLSSPGVSTVGHGLGIAPHLVITKRHDGTSDWGVQHVSTSSASQILLLNQDNAEIDMSAYGTLSRPTSSVFSVNASSLIGGIYNDNYVAYCFAPVAGYSSFGSYTGNGSTTGDGPFVYTGFRPKFVLIKTSSITGQNWYILDSARDSYNLTGNKLEPNTSNQENASPNNATTNSLDFLSNGFKLRTANDGTNQSSATYIYAAFAESPFQYARAR